MIIEKWKNIPYTEKNTTFIRVRLVNEQIQGSLEKNEKFLKCSKRIFFYSLLGRLTIRAVSKSREFEYFFYLELRKRKRKRKKEKEKEKYSFVFLLST